MEIVDAAEWLALPEKARSILYSVRYLHLLEENLVQPPSVAIKRLRRRTEGKCKREVGYLFLPS
jgi:hypothetical protein